MNPETSEIDVVVKELENLKETDSVALIANDNTELRVPKDFLLCCSHFEMCFKQKPNLVEMHVDASRQTLRTYKHYLEGMPARDIDNVFHVMKFACSIKCKHFVRFCAHAAKGIEIPVKADANDVREVICQLLKYIPIRTGEHYEALLKTLTNVPDRNALIDAVIGVLQQGNAQSNVYMNTPLSLPLLMNEVTVALMDDIQGNPMTAILLGDRWVPNNIFGERFCPFEEHVKHFHLCFGRYVVYQTLDRSIMMKSLDSDAPKQMLFRTSKFFRSRCNELHVIARNEKNRVDTLFKWDHDEEAFIELFANPNWQLRTAHTNSSGLTILVLRDGSVMEFSDSDCMHATTRSNEIVTDYIDGWTMEEDNTYRQLIRVDGKDVRVSLNAPAHIGYNVIGVSKVRDGAFQTIAYAVNPNGCFTQSSTALHGKIRTISDVVIL